MAEVRTRPVPRPRSGRSPGTGKRKVITLAAVAILLVTALALLALYGRGGGSLPGWLSWLGPDAQGLLEPSGPEEAVLRTLRLAGYDHAVVGEDGGLVVVRLDIPYVRTPADVELSWQTALGAAFGAFPEADRYVAQLFSDGESLLEVGIEGDAFRRVMDVSDRTAEGLDPASGLRREADFLFLTGGGVGGG